MSTPAVDRGAGFYKRQPDGELLFGSRVDGPGFLLTVENHGSHTYPVEGWTWYLSEAEVPPAPLVAVSSTEQANATTIRSQAAEALTSNRTYLALTTPTAAQNRDQIQALTRQMNGLVRLVLGQLDGTN